MEPVRPHGLPRESEAFQRILCPTVLEGEEGTWQACPSLGEHAGSSAGATAEKLASVARRLGKDSGDEVLEEEEETRPAAEPLVPAGRRVLPAPRELRGRPENPRSREELAASPKRVLTETGKILQMEEAAGARKVIRAASRLSERLSALRDAGDAPGLLAAFRAFSEALLLLSDLTARHLQELRDCPRKKSLAQTLRLLQKCVPLLHAAKRSHLKRSRDGRASLSKEYAFRLTERTIKELTSLLLDDTGSEEPRDGDGTFSQHVSRLLALLSRPDPARLSDGEFGAHVEAVVFHCVLLADSSRPDLKAELVKGCWDLLRLRKSIRGHLSRAGPSPGESSLQKECRTMREELGKLDRAALAATLCQILHAFLEGQEPLRRLVEEALSLAGTGRFPAGQGGFLRKLQPLTASFFAQAQQILRAADFVLARCTETQTAREIVEEVEYLKRLLASLPPLLAEMGGNTARRSAAERLRSLAHAWAGTTENLLRRFEETVGTREFLQLSVREMAKHRERCEKALASQDPARLSWHATRLSSWARWAVEAAARYVDGATDPVFRNGLLVWVEQLADSILELKAVAALCPERLSHLQTRDVFSKAASCLLDAARRVRDGLDGSNHPDILSPLRDRVRSADVAKALELSPSPAGLKTVTGEAALQEAVSSRLSPGNGHADAVPRTKDTHPVIAALLAATSTHDTAAVNAACSALLELSEGCIDAAKEALPVAEAPQTERLGQYQKIALLTPRVISLARETAPGQRPPPGKLLRTALALSERICQTKECLAAAAGSWYRLSQQVLGFISSADFPSGKQALEETVTGLAGAVQFAGDIARGNPTSPDVRESFLQVQAKFSRAQMVTKALLEKAASFQGSCSVGKASLELRCVQWAVSVRVLLGAVDRFIGRDLLFLKELRDAVENKLCPRSLLAAASENSLRLQEAARLSCLSCAEGGDRGEILALREEIKVLMEALLEASDILSVSLLPAASLYVRFELLQRDLALRAKALLLHLEKVNGEYLRVIRDVVGPALSPLSQEERERSKQAFEEKASRLTANVRWVKATLQDVLEASTQLQSQENLLSVADHLLVLTSEAVGSAGQLFRSHRDEGRLRLDGIVWYWSAQAHYLVTQLRAARGIGGHVLQLIGQHLQNAGDRRAPKQRDSSAKLFSALELDALSRTTSAETRPSGSGGGSGAAGEAPETRRNGPPSVSLASSPAKHQTENSDTWQGGPGTMPQVTKDMATRMLHMTQFLRKKGPILSKDQLVACAKRIASDGRVLVKFGRVVAKHCLDERCAAELLRAAEHTHTVSSQLGIVARVKAVTAESKSSSELLVSNAQNLIHAVSHVLKAAEAACIKGLRQPPPGSEEEEAIAAFCTQWRKNLLWHRAKESLNSDRDELGLRKTRARAEPTLMAMVREQPRASQTY